MAVRPLRIDDKGSAAVEFGLLFPFLAMLLVGVAELGRAIYQHQIIVGAVRDATRYLSRMPNAPANATAQQRARNLVLYGRLDGSGARLIADGPPVTVGFTFPATASPGAFVGSATMVKAVASYPFQPMTGFSFTKSITITVSHVERYIGE